MILNRGILSPPKKHEKKKTKADKFSEANRKTVNKKEDKFWVNMADLGNGMHEIDKSIPLFTKKQAIELEARLCSCL